MVLPYAKGKIFDDDKNQTIVPYICLFVLFVAIVACTIACINASLSYTDAAWICLGVLVAVLFCSVLDAYLRSERSKVLKVHAELLDPSLDPGKGEWTLENGILKRDGEEIPSTSYHLKFGSPPSGKKALLFKVKGNDSLEGFKLFVKRSYGEQAFPGLKFVECLARGHVVCCSDPVPATNSTVLLRMLACAYMQGVDGGNLVWYLKSKLNQWGNEVMAASAYEDLSLPARGALRDFCEPGFRSCLYNVKLDDKGLEEFLERVLRLTEQRMLSQTFISPVEEESKGGDLTEKKVYAFYVPPSLEDLERLEEWKKCCASTKNVVAGQGDGGLPGGDSFGFAVEESQGGDPTEKEVYAFCVLPSFKVSGKCCGSSGKKVVGVPSPGLDDVGYQQQSAVGAQSGKGKSGKK